MTTALEFPNNCSTNVYTLNDFGEIAYIVCTVATPPNHDSAAIPTPGSTLARLRKTERQFREASILAALDVDTCQLFTFYKKVDIANARDQKTLLSKFGYVLRSNTCTIAYKTAARLPDLIKPEQARLYRLFTTAVVSSIKLLPNGDSALQPVGPNVYLVEGTPSDGLDWPQSSRRWSLYSVDLQIITSGHVILTLGKHASMSFLRLLEVYGDSARARRLSEQSAAVYLVPGGQVARLIRREAGDKSNKTGKPGQRLEQGQALDIWKGVWKELLPQWLKENMNMTIDEDVVWIEAEVPLQEVDASTPTDQTSPRLREAGDGQIMWRPVYWPASLCFVVDDQNDTPLETPKSDADPMQFVQDWLTGTGQQSGVGLKSGKLQHETLEDDDEPLFADDGPFDVPEHLQLFGPPAFPNSHSIYPTPPDVTMTHHTPGLSSVDGIGVTPANFALGPSETAKQHDTEMQDFGVVSASSQLANFDDEDLFEEIPDANFDQEGNGDEPNWDFFDQPGIGNKSNPMVTSHRDDFISITSENHEERNELEDSFTRGDAEMEVSGRTSGLDDPSDAERPSTLQEIMEARSASPVKGGSISHKDEAGGRPTSSKRTGSPRPVRGTQPNPSGRRRGSSIYDGVQGATTLSNHDRKYTADGDYWFDPNPAIPTPKNISAHTAVFHMSSSTSSESGSSVDGHDASVALDNAEQKSPPIPRKWTEYQPGSPPTTGQADEVRRESINLEAQQLLDLLKVSLVEPPSPSDFQLHKALRNIQGVTPSKLLQVAQILVEQVSQTSLMKAGHYIDRLPETSNDYMEVNIDLSGINTFTQASTVQQLINIKPDSTSTNCKGRVLKLPTSQICVRRADQPLFASASIMEFWDTLNLQPESGAKVVTAFCLHPSGGSVAEGCSNFLQRMTDTYNSCALGKHSTGRIPGVTEDGLCAWGWNVHSQGDFHKTCRRFGRALAQASDLHDTIIVYMVARDKSVESYLQTCEAFLSLFESFRQSLGDRQNSFDVALQIVPLSFIADPETLVVPPQSAYVKLAIEVYNRIPPGELSGSPAAGGSAVVLAQPENSVHFRLSPTFSSPLSKYGPCLHLAYSVTADHRWITAAWTDELGRVALSMTYCLRKQNSPRERPRREIFQEMWEISHDIMGKMHSTWRLAIAREGYYEPAELQDWEQVIKGPSPPHKQCLALLISIQLQPALRVFPPSMQTKTGPQGMQNTYGTPASTPQASITSPDQLVPATPTPGGSSIMSVPTPNEPGFDPNTDSDLTLVDPTEESWGIILPYGVNQTANMVDLRPALVSCMLIKRKGTKVEDGCLAIEVNLISTLSAAIESAETSTDGLLEDLMTQYRRLVTLAMTRGCVDPLHECVPWHIITAAKGSHALDKVL
ncbi:mediator of RNA polymerase II transcription subunit 13 [Exophiala dermatitidis]|nr:mediator of RNA polymerase II transcription subunit 13 [Exophiala dermatitidis]KAJ4672445.1 mediator of RNA polymerase II transcription subunit 13 [Exophiala dermatitidis]KAJ4679643.1 mediator of RNA polymerase II transcription subunit 13 [Exophiala dermatitidis]KAJ4695375.1 mediator of RNA polymerase II transcription subunit 13 [Exophiala dermatitidis]